MAQDSALECPHQCSLHDCTQCSETSCPLLHYLLSECIKAACAYLSNKVAPHYRRTHYDAEFSQAVPCLPSNERETDLRIVWDSLSHLPQLDRLIIVEYRSGTSFAELSSWLGIKLDTVRKLYYRGLARLRRILGIAPRYDNSDESMRHSGNSNK